MEILQWVKGQILSEVVLQGESDLIEPVYLEETEMDVNTVVSVLQRDLIVMGLCLDCLEVDLR